MNNAAPQHDIALPCESRQQPRTHLFVLAALHSDGRSTPVHIRNMSPLGALIEAAGLPEVGARIELKRGRLHATGRLAWRAGRRAGIGFEAAVHVTDWMSRQISSGQERVDSMIASVKLDGSDEAVHNEGLTSIEAELSQLRSDLAEMASLLIADVIVAATHPEIQTIDISLQRIDRIRQRLNGEG